MRLTYVKAALSGFFYQWNPNASCDDLRKEVDMAREDIASDRPLCTKRELMPCETPGCSESCAYAYSCHEKRMGRTTIFWPGVALAAALVVVLLV